MIKPLSNIVFLKRSISRTFFPIKSRPSRPTQLTFIGDFREATKVGYKRTSKIHNSKINRNTSIQKCDVNVLEMRNEKSINNSEHDCFH